MPGGKSFCNWLPATSYQLPAKWHEKVDGAGRDLGAIDLLADADPDLAVANQLSGNVSVLPGSNGGMTGIVTDAAGAALPGASVVAVNLETAASRRAVSSGAGVYTLAGLAPGRYRIDVVLSGFGPVRRQGVRIETGAAVRLDFELAVGPVNESVAVTADAPLQRAAASLGQVVSAEKLAALPEPPPATIREEERHLRANVEDLERHVADRKREADEARAELGLCRARYLEVVGSTLADYRQRAAAISTELRKERELAFYGAEDLTPSRFYREPDALIGVGDDGLILGLENDYGSLNGDKDKFELHLRQVLSNYFNQTFVASKVKTSFPMIGDLEICQVEVGMASQPLVMQSKDQSGRAIERLYVRSGNSSQEIPLSQAHEFFQDHFK